MILADRTIRNEIEEGRLFVHPDPDDEQFQPASLDIRLGSSLYDTERDRVFESQNSLTLQPGRLYLGHTEETIGLPDDTTAMIAGRSSIGRKGVVVHLTAGWCDPGFSGELTLEMVNFSENPVMFDPGARIAQLVFMRLDRPSKGYDGQYQDQAGPTGAGEL